MQIFGHRHGFSLKTSFTVVTEHSGTSTPLAESTPNVIYGVVVQMVLLHESGVLESAAVRSGPRCNSHHPPVHCRLRSFMMECWTTRLNDEWWVWVNYMSEKYRYVSQTSLLSMSDTGRLPTHTHTHTRPVSVVYRESVSRSLRQSAATVIDGVWKWHKSDCCWQTCNTKEISRSDGCVWGY